jgi:hypothetical protein
MGPPKKVQNRILSYGELQRQRNYFEYRYDEQMLSYYLLNPMTGEKIPQTNYDLIDRAMSIWIEPVRPNYIASAEAIMSSNVHSIILNPQTYQARRRGVYRRFRGYRSQYDAASHIITVARGFLARKRVRQLIRQRYCKVFDPNTKLYYFQDNHDPNAETSWYKPRLAYIDDILVNNILDADDYMQGAKYSDRSGIDGPYYRLGRCGKAMKSRAEHSAFLDKNPKRESAVTRHEQIDLESIQIGSVIAWLDKSALVDVQMTDYEFMRTVESAKDWGRVIECMRSEPDNEYIQLYGFFSFAKNEVPVDSSGLLDLVSHRSIHTYELVGLIP